MAAKGGINLTITSTYRSYAYQANTAKLPGGASQGNSPHGWGGAIDIAELYGAVNGSTDPTVNAQVRANNAVYLWLAENGPKVGWINPRRLADGAGVDECWHWEWWGTANLDFLK
jgi:LAS superfamily LD-carboxypeptidase LdcB